MDASAGSKAFVDTNVLVYAVDSDEPQKQAVARGVIANVGSPLIVISGQVLGEFYWTATRKLASPLTADEASQAIDGLARLTVVPISRELVRSAIELVESSSISYWDALIVKAASSAGCRRLLTEDLNHGQVIDGVQIENPFLGL